MPGNQSRTMCRLVCLKQGNAVKTRSPETYLLQHCHTFCASLQKDKELFETLAVLYIKRFFSAAKVHNEKK